MIYHRGLLMLDRQHDDKVNQKAHEVWKEHRAGRVILFQRRLGDGDYEYHSIRKKKRK